VGFGSASGEVLALGMAFATVAAPTTLQARRLGVVTRFIIAVISFHLYSRRAV
jgi:hypothetical protein